MHFKILIQQIETCLLNANMGLGKQRKNIENLYFLIEWKL